MFRVFFHHRFLLPRGSKQASIQIYRLDLGGEREVQLDEFSFKEETYLVLPLGDYKAKINQIGDNEKYKTIWFSVTSEAESYGHYRPIQF